MSKYLVTDSQLEDIADAIRAKSGGSSPLAFPAGFVSEIGSIQSAETVYWNNFNQLPYWKNTIYPLATLRSNTYFLREASMLESLSAPEVTELEASYLFYGSTIKTASFPKLETIKSGATRVFGNAMSLESISIGSVGHGFLNLAGYSNMFYGMGNTVFVINLYCTGDLVDDYLSKMRANGAAKATINFYASESTSYNNVAYNAGDLMLKSEVA